MLDYVRLVAILAPLCVPLVAGPNDWTRIGPEGGSILQLAIDPQTPTIVYAATCAGIFKSVDAGATWAPTDSGLTALPCPIPGQSLRNNLALDPQNTGTVYVVAGCALYKTSDGGTSWNSILRQTPSCLDSLTMDSRGTLYSTGNGGLLKSTDGGANWTQIRSGAVAVIAIDPQDPDTLYVAGAGGLFKSTDGGATWNLSEFGLPQFRGGDVPVDLLAIDPQNPSTLYAAGQSNIFKSDDGGASWSPASFGLLPSVPQYNGRQVTSLAVDPQNSSLVYAIVYQSSRYVLSTSADGAASWTSSSDTTLAASSLHTITPDPQQPGALYLGTANGVLKTSDAGAHWNSANSGMVAIQVQHILPDPYNAGTLFAVTSDGLSTYPVLFKTTDAGKTWTPSDSGLPQFARDIVASPYDPGTLYVVSRGVFKSQDFGANWTRIWNNTNDSVGPLAIDPQNPNIMYIGLTTCTGLCDDKIAKSVDGGYTWTSLPSLRGRNCCSSVYSIVVDPQNSSRIWVGMNDDNETGNGLWETTDGGATWTNLYAGDINSMAVDPRNPDTIYVSDNCCLGKTTAGGAAWTDANAGLEHVCCGLVVVDPDDSTVYYAGSNLTTGRTSVFYSSDNGSAWTQLGSELPGFTSSLNLDRQDPRTVYASTTNGLYAITIAAPE